MDSMKPPKTCVVRARCTESEKRLTQHIAQQMQLDESDILRMALKHLARRWASRVPA